MICKECTEYVHNSRHTMSHSYPMQDIACAGQHIAGVGSRHRMCWTGHIKHFCCFDMSTCEHRMCTIGHNMSSRAHGMSQTWVNLDIPCSREHILCRNVKTYYALTRTWYVHSAFLMRHGDGASASACTVTGSLRLTASATVTDSLPVPP